MSAQPALLLTLPALPVYMELVIDRNNKDKARHIFKYILKSYAAQMCCVDTLTWLHVEIKSKTLRPAQLPLRQDMLTSHYLSFL